MHVFWLPQHERPAGVAEHRDGDFVAMGKKSEIPHLLEIRLQPVNDGSRFDLDQC